MDLNGGVSDASGQFCCCELANGKNYQINHKSIEEL